MKRVKEEAKFKNWNGRDEDEKRKEEMTIVEEG